MKYKNKWCHVYEQHFINNKWQVYYGNYDGTVSTKMQYTIGGNTK